jgi:hypothetical protein
MGKTLSQLPFPLCASCLDRPYRKGLQHERQKHKFAREVVGLTEINSFLRLLYIEGEVDLWRFEPNGRIPPEDGSRCTSRRAAALLSATVTRADHHWQHSKAPIDGSRSAYAAD